MEIKVKLNGKNVIGNVEADTVLLDWLREKGCLSVKRGCDTSNCGLCTVFMDNKPILSCSKLAVQADGHEIKTLEGLQEEALEFVTVRQIEKIESVAKKCKGTIPMCAYEAMLNWNVRLAMCV